MDDSPGSERPESPFAKLPPGRTKRSPEETALHRRRRLMKATVELVARKGYRDTTLRELVALAGVSNTSFYEQFRSVRECFLATYDEIVGRGIEQAMRAYASQEDPRNQLHAGFERYVDLSVEHPEETNFVLVEVLGLGAVGLAHRQRTMETFELIMRRALQKGMAESDELSEVTVRAIVGGIERVFHRRLRAGQIAELREWVEALVDWSLSYGRTGGLRNWHLPSAGPMAPNTEMLELAQPAAEMWDERPDSIAARVDLSQRERIVRAAAMVVSDRGYSRLSIPTIIAGAGVSSKTFYQQFGSAEEAFAEALDLFDQQVTARVAAAVNARWTWPEAIVAGLEALLAFTSEKPLLSRLALIQSLSAGGVALERLERLQDRLLFLFNPDAMPADIGKPLPEVVVEAISGGIFAVVQHEVANGRAESVRALLPELSFFALAPLSVP